MQNSFQPTVYGKYILLHRVAMGGMAEVFRAKSFGAEGYEKQSAIKRLYPHLSEDPAFVKMFISEAKLVATLNHINIVPIYDFGKEDDLYYISMEYVRGVNLADLIIRCRELQRELPLRLAVWILLEICNGLDYAHRKHNDLGVFLNLIHRDITPQNILLSYEGEVKITDFGIAKAKIVGRDETTDGVLKGKFSYMSPEQVRGERMDRRSDIFSFGIVAWELLTYRKMFDGESDYQILEQVREVLIKPPREINPNIPQELNNIILKALTRHPGDRYSSIAQLRMALLRFLSNANLLTSRAHLSAFLKELFQGKQDDERDKLMQEARMAKQIRDANRDYFFPQASSHQSPIKKPETPKPVSRVFASSAPAPQRQKARVFASSESPDKPQKEPFPEPSLSKEQIEEKLSSTQQDSQKVELDFTSEDMDFQTIIPPKFDHPTGLPQSSPFAQDISTLPGRPQPPQEARGWEANLPEEMDITAKRPTLSAPGYPSDERDLDDTASEMLADPFSQMESTFPGAAQMEEDDEDIPTQINPVPNITHFPSAPPIDAPISSPNSQNHPPAIAHQPAFQSAPPYQEYDEEDDWTVQTFQSSIKLPVIIVFSAIVALIIAWLFLRTPSQNKQVQAPPVAVQASTGPAVRSMTGNAKPAQLKVETNGKTVAYVYLNGVLQGLTPIQKSLPSGRYRLEVHFTKHQRPTIQRKNISLRPGERKRLLVSPQKI